MIYNMELCEPELIKIIDYDSKITCVNYGPFDNGYVLLGFANGSVLIFDYPNLERLELLNISTGNQITSITYDPTNYIFVSTSNGEVYSLSCIEKKINYMYIDLGKNTYCTVTVPRRNSKANPAKVYEEEDPS
jgi:WD40 repeat protein